MATRPSFVIGFGLLLVAISLTTGRFAYLLIALVVVVMTMLLAGSAFTAGVFWILGLSTITGFFQRLILYKTGQSSPSDYVRFALEISISLYLILIAVRRLKRSGITSRIHVKWLDVVVSLYLLLSTIYVFNLFYVEQLLITIYGWRWVCIPIFMYYIGRTIGSKPGVMDRINKYIIVLLLLQAGYGAYQAVVGYPDFEQPWINQRAAMQRYASVEDSMFIAGKARIPALTEGHTSSGFLIPVLFLWLLYLPGNLLSKRWRFVRRLALICGLLFLIFSNERSAVGMVAIGIGTVFFLRSRKKLGFGVFLVAVPALVLFIFMASQIDPSKIPWSEDTIVLRRLLELLNPFKSGTLAGRINVYWPVYWRFFLANPLGYGVGSFHATSATQTSEWGRSPHNMYLQVLLETGVIGLFIFIAVLAFYFKYLYNYNKMRLDVDQRTVVYSSAAMYIAFLAIGMANQPIETFPLAIHFWFLMGLVTSYIAKKVAERRRDFVELTVGQAGESLV
ncbi:MAG: O-antigen ligase family protein [Anaerolineae bacterium]